MNTTNQLVAIIDIGTNEVVVMVGRQGKNRKIDIVGYGTQKTTGLRRGTIFNVKETVVAVKGAVAAAERCIGGQIKKVYAGINGQKLRSIQKSGYHVLSNFGEFTNEHVNYLIREVRSTSCESDEKVYHVTPQTFSVDSETGIQNPEGVKGKKITGYFNVIVGPRQYYDLLAEVIHNAGLELVREIAIPSILGDAALSRDEKDTGVAIFDLGAGSSTMAIYTDGYLAYSATIPFGGDVITKDIKGGCQVTLETAEKLKKKHGSAFVQALEMNTEITLPQVGGFDEKKIGTETLANIIEARTEDIFEAISYHFEETLEAEQFSLGKGVGIVLVGGGSKCHHIKELTEYYFGREVRHGAPLNIDEGNYSEILTSPVYSSALGLLQKGIRFNAKNGGKNFVSFEKEELESVETPRKEAWWKTGFGVKKLFEILEENNSELK